MKKYKAGDVLRLKIDLTRYIDDDKDRREIYIKKDTLFRVGYNVQYPECAYYELVEEDSDNPMILQEWNDIGHEVIDDNFEYVRSKPWKQEDIEDFKASLEEYKQEMREQYGDNSWDLLYMEV